jgi:Secretion system C-terminal sorting domain
MRRIVLSLLVLIALSAPFVSYAQPTVMSINQDVSGTYANSTMTLVGGAFRFRIQENATGTSSGTRNWQFNADSYFNQWGTLAAAGVQTLASYNSVISANVATASANFVASVYNSNGRLPATLANYYYTYNIMKGTSYASQRMSILETSYNPVGISSVTQAAGTNGSRTITITTSATPNAAENIFVRYSTNSYAASSIVQATGSGTTWTATIPWQNATVSFYAYSSNRSKTSIDADVASLSTQEVHDLITLNLNNNSGTNYSWTPAVVSGAVVVFSTGGTGSAGVGYTSLTNAAGAFLALNGGTAHTGTVSVYITADVTTEAGTNGLNSSTLWTSMTINPIGARTISGSVAAPMIDMAGADNVTINGLNTGGNSLIISNTNTGAASATSTLRFINDATVNTITNCSILGSATMATGTNGGTIFFSTSSTTGNDNNTISNCNIGPAGVNLPTKAIYGNGSTGATTSNNNNTITGCNIFDFFNAATASRGVLLNSGNTDWTISNNRFYQTASRVFTTGVAHYVIDINSTAGTLGVGFNITGNIIGFAAAAGTGTYTLSGTTNLFRAISISSVGTTTATNVQGNTITNISHSTTTSGSSNSSPCMMIYIEVGLANVGDLTPNVIGSQTATGAISFVSSSSTGSDFHAIYNFSSVNAVISNNNIGGITVNNSSTGSITFYGIRANTGTGVTATISGNTVGGSVANSINNTATSTSSRVFGISLDNPISTVTGNLVRNMTMSAANLGTGSSASVIGINHLAATAVGHTYTANTIHSLSNTNATGAVQIIGLHYGGPITGTNLVNRNFIHSLSLSTNSATAEIRGINVNNGLTSFENNMVRLGIDAAGTSLTNNFIIYGIFDGVGTNNYLHNSIYVGGSSVGTGAAATYAFNSPVTINTRIFRNNIFWNARSNNTGTGKHYGVLYGGSTLNPTGLTASHNLIFANGTGGVFGRFNATDVTTLAGWQSATGQDASSINANPTMILPTGTSTTVDLHIHATNPTPIEGVGTAINTATVDFDNQTRTSFSPVDIGADAGNFVYGDASAPVISYTALSNTCSTGNIVLSGVTITDASGVPTTGALQPRIYYKKNAGAYFSSQGTLTSGSGTNGTWSFTIIAADMGGVALADVVSYYVIAQDIVATPNISSNALGAIATNVNTVSTAPSSPATYTINPILNGTYTVGTAGTYTTLTAAVAAYNTSCLTGPVTFSLLDASYASETYPITINNNADASTTNTLTIKPTQAATTFSGSSASALIVLNGADYVIINGSTSATANTVCPIVSATRNLSFTNTNTSTSSAVIWIQTAATGVGVSATNNTIKNCTIVGSGTSQTLIGIGSGGTTIGLTSLGTSNNNNVVENNNISGTQYGVYSQGASAATKNSGTIINQNLFNTSAGARGGILVGFENSITISRNTISNVSSSVSDVFGISCGFGTAMSISTTAGNEVTNATILYNTIGSVVQTSTLSAFGIGVSAATSGTTLIANNMIYGVSSNGTFGDFGGGIVLGGGTGSTTNVYYNTVSMQGTISGATAATQASACFAITNATGPVADIKNNIFTNTQLGNTSATVKFMAIGLTQTTFTGLTSNNNDLYAAGAGPGTYQVGITGGLVSGTVRSTLANWQAATSTDAASINVLPNFTSTTDLHLVSSTNGSFNAVGAVLSTTTDFDCSTRDVSTPDIGADEFAPPADDAGVTAIVLPSPLCGGSQTVQATIKNYGSATLNTVLVDWTVNAVSQPQVSLTALGLAGGASTTVTLGTFTFVSGTTYSIVGVTSLPNGNADSNSANDSFTQSSINTGLTGDYTVGTAGNFTTITAAVAAYNTRGICGPTRFLLLDATYSGSETFPISINQAAGTSTTNTLTIKPNTGVTSAISGSSTTAIFKFNGADNVTIDGHNGATVNSVCPPVVSASRNLTITNTSTATATAAIWLSSLGASAGCTGNTVMNTTILCGVTQSTSANITYGIIGSGATIGATVDGLANNTNSFINNRVSTVSHGIYMRGAASPNNNTGNIARQNFIGGTAFGTTQVGTSGITMQYQTSSLVTYNEVQFVGNLVAHTTNTNSRAGISILDCVGASATHNKVHDIADEKAQGAFGISVGASSVYTTSNVVANNMIYNVRANGTTSNDRAPYGIAVGPGDADKVVNNSVLMTGDIDPVGSTAATQSGAGIRVNPIILSTTNLTLSNNIVSVDLNSNSNIPQFAVILPVLAANFSVSGTSGTNNYYVNTATAGMNLGGQGLTTFTAITTLSTWQTAYSFESASDNVAPTFTSSTDLHLNTSSFGNLTFENTGTVISGVTTDYDCDTRSATTPDVGADEFTTTVIANDAAVTNVSAPANPCPGSATTISVTILNNGSATLNTVLVDWTLNAVAQTQASFTGLGLAPGASTTLTLGTANLSATLSNAIVATSSLPNGLTDGFTSNDSFSLASIATQLNGTYTVGVGGNFTTITAAVTAYNTRGICGPSVFSLTDASYSGGETFPFTINAAAGASSTNTLTIKPATGVSAVIQGQALSNTIFILNGADYIVIDGNNAGATNPSCGAGTAARNLTVRVVSTSTSNAVIWLQTTSGADAATNNIVRNCIVEGNSTATTLIGIGSGSTAIGTSSLGNGNNNNRIENNDIRKAQYGIYSQGASAASKNTGNVFNQNLLNAASTNNIGKGGIVLGFENNVQVQYNNIANLSSSIDALGIALGAISVSATALSGNEVSNATVNANTIGSIVASGTNTAIGILSATGTTAGWTNLISNNMISGVISNATPSDFTCGIALGGGTGTVRVYNNTVLMQGDRGASTTAYSYALGIIGATPSVDIQNNILVNTQTTSSTGKSYAIGLGYTSTTGNYSNLISNKNNFFVSGTSALLTRVGSLGTTGGTDFNTLSGWTTETGRDGSSFNVNAVFTSSSNLHLDNLSAVNISLNNAATALASVTQDTDCDTRSVSTPDIGADEFAPIICSGAPTPGTISASAAGPFCNVGASTLTATGGTVAIGITYQWQSSVSGTFGSFTDIPGATSSIYLISGQASSEYYQCLWLCSGTPSAPSNVIYLVVNPNPNVLVSPTSGTICGSGNVPLVASGASTYTWTPTGAGLSALTGASVTATPTVTSVYTVTGTDANGCTASANATVFVSSALTVNTTGTPDPICVGGSSNLNVAPVITSYTAAAQTFNGTVNWSTQNNSTGGTPALAAWSLRSSGYTYPATTTTFNSPDLSQFYLSNSDAQGSGGTTATILQSIPISTVGMATANLNFFHYYRYNGTESANVEISLNGTTWSNLATYTSIQGAPGAFATVSISLSSYLNQPLVYVRFKYDADFDYFWAIDNVSITGTLSYTYAWTSTPVGFTSAVANPTVAPSTTTNYSVAVTSSIGCSTTGSKSIGVQPLAAVDAGSNTTTCAGSPFTFSGYAENTTGVSWTTTGAGTLSAPNTLTPTYTPTVFEVGTTITFTLNGTAGTPCSNVSDVVMLTVLPLVSFYQDLDTDGFGNPLVVVLACIAPPGYVSNNTDCNDTNALINPNTNWYADVDGDGYGSFLMITGCFTTPPYPGTVTNNSDCNDNNAAIGPCGSEICSNGLDDDGDGLIDEGCLSNDNRLGAINVANSNWYPQCTSISGSVLNAVVSPQGNPAHVAVGGGGDVWYKFTAPSTAVRIRVVPTGFNAVLELQTSSGTEIDFENATGSGVNEILNYGALTTGAVYYLAVRNYDATAGGAFTVCISPLARSGCDIASGSYDLCQSFKMRATGASNYISKFTRTAPTAGPTVSHTSTTQFPMSTPSIGNQYGSTYSVTVDAVYNLLNGAGSPESITVLGTGSCSIAINTQPAPEVVAAQRCPATILRGTIVSAKPFVCGAVDYRWRFTEWSACTSGAAVSPSFTRDRGAASPYMQMNFSTPVPLVPGSYYKVEVAPLMSYGLGSYGPPQIIQISSTSLMGEMNASEFGVSEFYKNGEEVIAASIYPNPNNGEMLNLNVTEAENVYVRILDNMGRVVYNNRFTAEGSLNTTVVFDRPLASGLYMIEMNVDGELITRRFVVEK